MRRSLLIAGAGALVFFGGPLAAGPAQAPFGYDEDADGVIDDLDACPGVGDGHDFPGQRVTDDGCPVLLVAMSHTAASVAELARDAPGVLTADCDYNRGVRCVMRIRVVLGRATARAAGLDARLIARRTVRLTTPIQQQEAHPDPRVAGSPTRGTLRLGLSRPVRRALGRLDSATFRIDAEYTLGSDEPVRLGSAICGFRSRAAARNCSLSTARR